MPKSGNVDIFEDYDKNEGKKIKPFINLFKTLSNYSKDIKKKKQKNKQIKIKMKIINHQKKN